MTDDQSTTTDEIPVTAEPPDSAFHLAGMDHITLIGSTEEETVAFYRDILGMPLVLRQPNLDAPDVTHLFFDTGDGRLLSFFVQEDRDSHQGRQRPGIGAVHHLAFRYEPDRLDEISEALDEHSHRYSEIDRGIFRSIYTYDHNGLTIELAADKFEIPDDKRSEVLALAQQKRIEAGAEYAKEEHLEAAIEELGLPVERHDFPSS
jgi:catechol 2,3-dioxygenase-like lactoylglutathione lyase family enzyme